MLLALALAATYLYDGARASLVTATHWLAPPKRRRRRARQYALFAVRRLPAPGSQLVPVPGPPGRLRRLATRALGPYLVPVLALVPSAVVGGGSARLGDENRPLPFPAPSLTRRVIAWAIDSAIVAALASQARRIPVPGNRNTVAGILWLGRDLWLSPFGPALTRPPPDTPDLGPLDPAADAQTAAFWHHQQAAVAENLDHDADALALVAHQSLRVALGALGPLATLVWAASSIAAWLAAPNGQWDGRTPWDRACGVQVVDLSVANAWATSGVVPGRPMAVEMIDEPTATVSSSQQRTLPDPTTSTTTLRTGYDADATAMSPLGADLESPTPPLLFEHDHDDLPSPDDPNARFAFGPEALFSTAYAATAGRHHHHHDLDDDLDDEDDEDDDDAPLLSSPLADDGISPPPPAPIRDSFFGGSGTRAFFPEDSPVSSPPAGEDVLGASWTTTSPPLVAGAVVTRTPPTGAEGDFEVLSRNTSPFRYVLPPSAVPMQAGGAEQQTVARPRSP
ncbi:hypothetical protein AMAG_03834 [Allomyces macrogynus ATCC 38327]|uniref:Uncharacterized protein n=1 Tax=Allomyces macrogynus (strain ATCC 38327) TaxID=578462 RepID=A0A0L0SB13_ALLM3|nr:hypothetical protein AMAG_03834 [Allomyces macrogynus ATCC 38327]|eukprot:KNE59575.1 hypothetical protein AMAG_03834 [Allomyces macrogynus ATCC 38327]